MAYTYSTTVESAIQTKFQKKLLEHLKGKAFLAKFGSNQKMVRGEGDTVRYNRPLRLAKQTTFNLSETSTSVTEKALYTNYVEASIGYVGDALKNTKGSKLISIVNDDTYVKEVADQALRTMEYLTAKQISRYSLHHRVDNDSTYETNATVTTATSTTEWRSTTLTESDNHWGETTDKVGYCCGTNPEAANYDNATLITDFAASTDACTVSALPQNNDTSTKFHVVRGTGLAATDKLTCAALARVAGLHELLQTPKFNGGIYRGIMHPGQHADLNSDSTYTNIIQYNSSAGLKELAGYRILRAYGIELAVVPEVYREDVDGTENVSGIVYNSPIFGRDSYAITKWSEGGDEFGIKTDFIKKADSGNIFAYMWWIVWNAMCAIATLRATNIVSLMTGATAQPVVL